MTLPLNTQVRIQAHRHQGWTGTITAVKYGQYTIALTHDCDGERLAAPHRSGPYVLSELKPIGESQ